MLNKAHKEEGREKAIVFLGAGTSVSAGIPLTDTIVRHIKIKFYSNPIIKECIKIKKDDYYSLMGALTADERRDLFHFYVTRDKVKLNIANIYLAQLLKLEYIDYIVTVNFDDLILKACTLFNFLPPVYDISNIKTITTTDIRKNSVIYLHGQYFGQWLLNNPDELQKVQEEVLRLFNAIKTRRTWIVIGYSGNDGIFNTIKSLGSFSNELFWVKNKFTENDKDVTEFIETPNINAHKIEGFYADSFFLKLHAELSKLNKGLQAPEIISKPFTFVKSVLQSINEIKEDDELNDNVKKMVINCNERIDKAIAEYENEGTEENLKQRIIDAILKGDFNKEEILSFENEATQNNYQNVAEQLSWYYNNWGIALTSLAKLKTDEPLFHESFEKYKTASEIDPKNSAAYNNWGNALASVAKLKKSEPLFQESFEKYKTASELSPKNAAFFNNWGIALTNLAKVKNNEPLFQESFEKYKTASEIDPKNAGVFNSWGGSLTDLAKLKNDELLFEESFEKYKTASEIGPKNADVFNSWGGSLSHLAKLKNDELLFQECFEKYKTASEIDPKNAGIFNNWGNALADLAKLKNDELLFQECFEKYKTASEIDPKNADIFNNWGGSLADLAKLKNDELLFDESLEKYKIALEIDPKNAAVFNNWGGSLTDLAKLKNDKLLFEESLEKYKTALEMDPGNADVFNNLGAALTALGKLLNDSKYFDDALEVLKKAYKLNRDSYNMSCVYALLLDKENALKYLEETLAKKLITVEDINKDDDWENFRNDTDFINLINQY